MDKLINNFDNMCMKNIITLPYIEDFSRLDNKLKKLVSSDFINISNRFFKDGTTHVYMDMDYSLIANINNDKYKILYNFLENSGYKIFEIIIKEIAYKKYNTLIEDINIFTLFNNYMDVIKNLITTFNNNI